MLAPHRDRLAYARAVLVACLVTSGACGDGRRISLGDASPRPYHFGPPVLVEALATSDKSDNPTLTDDLLEIYFTSDRGGTSSDVWFARRARPADPFGPPEAVAAVNTNGFETSSAISPDGLVLWFGSDRVGTLGNIDIWMATRASRTSPWTSPLNLAALNSTGRDVPRPPGLHGLVMPLSSDRAIPDLYQTLMAQRTDRGADFRDPVPVVELSFSDRSTVDAFLSDDGLTLFFSSSGLTEPSDLYVAWRRSLNDPFSIYLPLDDLNTATGDERDPWLTPDGRTLFFTSDRDGSLNIYTADVIRPAPP